MTLKTLPKAEPHEVACGAAPVLCRQRPATRPVPARETLLLTVSAKPERGRLRRSE